jgi:hypothetical protein
VSAIRMFFAAQPHRGTVYNRVSCGPSGWPLDSRRAAIRALIATATLMAITLIHPTYVTRFIVNPANSVRFFEGAQSCSRHGLSLPDPNELKG